MPTINDIVVEQTQFESSTRPVMQTFDQKLLIYALAGKALLVPILPDTRSCIVVQSLTIVEALHSKHLIRFSLFRNKVFTCSLKKLASFSAPVLNALHSSAFQIQVTTSYIAV